MDAPREVFFEFYQVGAYVKVSAIDPETLIEVSIVGAPEAGEEALKRAALKRLEMVIARRMSAHERPLAGARSIRRG